MIELTVQSESAKKAQAAYLRAWRKKNADKMREYRRRYWEKKAAVIESEVKCDDDNTKTGG